MTIFHLKLYAKAVESRKIAQIRSDFEKKTGNSIEIKAEYCYHILTNEPDFLEKHGKTLESLLSHSPFEKSVWTESQLPDEDVVEIGPRTAVKTATCTNILSVFASSGIENVSRVERSVRYHIDGIFDKDLFFEVSADKMTEIIYTDETTFEANSGSRREDFFEIDILGDRQNLEKANKELGLALDASDLDFYYDFFVNKMKRNPTDVELFDLAQSDSEHSRHWFFRGDINIDGTKLEKSLMGRIRETLDHSNPNSLIAFNDNSSAIRGFESVLRLRPSDSTTFSSYRTTVAPSHLIYSAETHNFPTAVCPFQGATTGTGGRIRDIHATGRGAYEIAGTVGYSFGNLNISGFIQPWESNTDDFVYPGSLSEPLKIAIEASNGASDYGNKFGEPVICGFARSFGLRLPDGERSEYLKPIMFSGGIGSIDDDQVLKQKCEKGMKVAKIGGPVYRIGVGGGAASSVQVQGNRENELDFAAVQRGDPEMGAKLHRVVRACAERGSEGNPLKSIHDQGAGGNGNVIKELVEGCGVAVSSSEFQLGDDSISLRELWTAEYQENDAALVDPTLLDALFQISKREKCHVSIVGDVIAEQRVSLAGSEGGRKAVDLDTQKLGERAKKNFDLKTVNRRLEPLKLPEGLTVREALSRVLHLPSVASKRYLTCKVDRSVTGLIAQQQCVGPLHTPLADVSVVALSHFDKIGGAVALGEQPIKMLIDPEKGARMCLAETIFNLVWAPISDLKDVKMSGNWMWAAKCDGEGARLVSAVLALCDGLEQIGCAIDGGKDSLSMAVCAGGEVVKSPGTLVLSAYVPCIDITKTITPDLKSSAGSKIIHIKCGSSPGKYRLGGSALAQVYSQIGNDTPDIENFNEVIKTFEIIQTLIQNDNILAGHDISDGGLIVALLEMAFAGNCGISASFVEAHEDFLSFLFAEECGVLIQVEEKLVENVIERFAESSISARVIAEVNQEMGPEATVKITFNSETLINEPLVNLREEWEQVGDKLGEYQTTKKCLEEAKMVRETCRKIEYKCDFEYKYDTGFIHQEQYFESAPRVAIIREEGSNGDREMASAFTLAGFQTFDVTMTDILEGHSLKQYRGVAFVGGFSYADVLGSAKGWAACVLCNEIAKAQFSEFRSRPDTFSFGVCNGCQLMAQLGWIGSEESEGPTVFLDDNKCGRFESTFGPVKIEKNNSIMLSNMEGSVLGLWSSHGEGRFTYRNPQVLENLKKNSQICVRYCDGEGKSNDNGHLPYPWNPNGSEYDVAAICSRDGRHLAMMPHSDRSFLSWQWPNYPWHHGESPPNISPWIQMFRNSYNWCTMKN